MKAKRKNPAARALGRIKSKARAAASRENGKKGGRPKGAKSRRHISKVDLGKLAASRIFSENPWVEQIDCPSYYIRRS